MLNFGDDKGINNMKPVVEVYNISQFSSACSQREKETVSLNYFVERKNTRSTRL